jgi:transcriptional regulator with XRE-family HTH domain
LAAWGERLVFTWEIIRWYARAADCGRSACAVRWKHQENLRGETQLATPAERLSLLLKAHGHSFHNAGDLCGVDHTTVMRMARGETESPVTLQKVAEGYGVPLAWLRGERDLTTDFAIEVLSRPLRERVLFIWEPERRTAYALDFLHRYDGQYTAARLADLLQVPEADVEGILSRGRGQVARSALERLAAQTGLPANWFQTGLVGREDVEEMLVGLAELVVTTLAEALGADVTDEEVREAAIAMVVA